MIISERDGYFDDAAVLAMAIAFERACISLRAFGAAPTVQEIIAERIIQVAKQGEATQINCINKRCKRWVSRQSPRRMRHRSTPPDLCVDLASMRLQRPFAPPSWLRWST